MSKTDLENTWEETEHDFTRLAKPLFQKLAEQLQLEEAAKGDVDVKIAVRRDKDTGDWTVTISAKLSASGAEIAHKASLSNRQLNFFDSRGV